MEARDAVKRVGLQLLEESPPFRSDVTPTVSDPHVAVRNRAIDLTHVWAHQEPQIDVDMRALRLGRLARLRRELARADCAACIFFDPQNIRYATDARNMTPFMLRNPGRYVFVPIEGPVILFEFEGCHHLAAGLETIDEIRPATTVSFSASGPSLSARGEHWVNEIDDLLRNFCSNGSRVAMDCVGSRSIAVERMNLPAAASLAGRGCRIIDAQDPIERARAVKLPEELLCIRESLRVVEEGVARMRDALRPGMTENALWSLLHQTVIEQNGEYVETRLLSSGPKTNPWFQESGPRKIEASDLVALDTDVVGPFGYYADFSRTFFAGSGRPSAEQRRLYALAYEQIHHDTELLQAGRTFREISEQAWSIPEEFIKNRYFVLAHGVGMTGEYPYILHRQDFDEFGYDGLLEENMTLCVESYVGSEYGNEGVKLEHQVLVTANGPEVLSNFPFDEDLL